jgi:phage terminase large subunit
MLRAIFKPHARVAVKGCHSSGKTFGAADAVLMAIYDGADVITTAPTDDQVKGVMWSQIHEALRHATVGGWGDILQKEIQGLDGVFAIGRATNQSVRFQGYHARPGSYLLIVIDEAPGLQADIFNAIEGMAAGGDVRVLMLGNPTIPSGPFFDIFDSDSPIWAKVTIDAFDTPNLAGLDLDGLLALPEHELDDNGREYLVTRRWVRDRYLEWGVDHPEWQSRVRGEFPQNADVSLIWRSWLDDAKAKGAEYDPAGGPLAAGVDVAGPGDDETVCVVRQDANVLGSRAWSSPEPRGDVLAFLRDSLHRGLKQVNVDTAGIGYYFAEHLRDNLPESVVVNNINVGEGATSDQAKEKYLNLRAELYWALRERFQDGNVRGLIDPLAISQLASIQYHHDARGRVVIEKKEDARKRGVKSPDRAEALMLAFAPENQSQLLARAVASTAHTREPAGVAVDSFILATRGKTGRGARAWGKR